MISRFHAEILQPTPHRNSVWLHSPGCARGTRIRRWPPRVDLGKVRPPPSLARSQRQRENVLTEPTGIDDGLRAVGEAAAALVEPGMKVGLGTGRAAAVFVRCLGKRVAAGLRVAGVPTSEATRSLAMSLGIPLLTLAEAGELDLTIDGADEVDPHLDLIKGLGGALVREKVVATSSKRLVIVIGAEKVVSRLGVRTPLPVEVIPFAQALAERLIRGLGGDPHLRELPGRPGTPVVTDNANYILDCRFPGIDHPRALEVALREIPGVVGTGLFLAMTERVLVQERGTVRVLTAETREARAGHRV